MFQIAGTIGIAANLSTDAVFRATWEYRDYFSLPDSSFAGWLTIARSGEAWPLAGEIDERARVYLQDLGLWKTRRDAIFRWFQPSELAQRIATKSYSEILGLPSKTALHVRRGDYLAPGSSIPPCPASYYKHAIDLVRGEDPSTQFLVFSDDIEWCRKNLSVRDAHFMAGNPDWLDMTLMSRCEHHICANSTFSWWGAFLSADPSPIVPWLTGINWPLRMIQPDGWRELEVEPDRA